MEELRNQRATREEERRPELNWFRELLLIGVFYALYSWIRNQFGSAAVGADIAFQNARHMIDAERFLGLYIEADIQSWFLDWKIFLQFWNIFYGTLHFIITVGALLYLYFRQPQAYPRWRTVGLTTTALALIGFATYPLMPPRLLGNCRAVGACIDSPFVDTVAEIGGLWSFDSGMMESLSNQYAAMPSLHFAWACWSYLMLRPYVQHRFSKIAISLYPPCTLLAIIVTANHYWIDAVGGALIMWVGYGIGTKLQKWIESQPFQTVSSSEKS
jgi:hypothetical protein